MSLARKMGRAALRASMRETRKRSKAVRAVVDTLSAPQRESVRAWAMSNPGRVMTPDLVRSIAMGLTT